MSHFYYGLCLSNIVKNMHYTSTLFSDYFKSHSDKLTKSNSSNSQCSKYGRNSTQINESIFFMKFSKLSLKNCELLFQNWKIALFSKILEQCPVRTSSAKSRQKKIFKKFYYHINKVLFCIPYYYNTSLNFFPETAGLLPAKYFKKRYQPEWDVRENLFEHQKKLSQWSTTVSPKI